MDGRELLESYKRPCREFSCEGGLEEWTDPSVEEVRNYFFGEHNLISSRRGLAGVIHMAIPYESSFSVEGDWAVFRVYGAFSQLPGFLSERRFPLDFVEREFEDRGAFVVVHAGYFVDYLDKEIKDFSFDYGSFGFRKSGS